MRRPPAWLTPPMRDDRAASSEEGLELDRGEPSEWVLATAMRVHSVQENDRDAELLGLPTLAVDDVLME